MTLHDKEKLFRIANAAVRDKAEFLALPEFFIPALWLKDITRFSQNNKLTIISGLRYIRCTDRVFNCTAIILPFQTSSFKQVITLFREKNFYAPKEKAILWKLGYLAKDPEIPWYYIVNENGLRFSSILCYEFTDISSRERLKSKIDALFVPQLNSDTNYFSAIVESTSRDLHCVIIQANTSRYGDSRITGPYDTIHKNLLQIKGGINDAVIVGELKLNDIKAARDYYRAEHDMIHRHCFSCKRIKKTSVNNLSSLFRTCEECRYNIRYIHRNDAEKQKLLHVKDVPPRFKS